MNAWIRARLSHDETGAARGSPDIYNIGSLKNWLEGQSGQTAVAIAVRSVLRDIPHLAAKLGTAEVASTVFRAAALARVAVRYPFRRASSLRADTAAAAAAASTTAATSRRVADAFDHERAEASASLYYAPAAGYYAEADIAAAAADVARAVAALAAANAREAKDYVLAAFSVGRVEWREVKADADALGGTGADRPVDRPLWSQGQPKTSSDRWIALLAALPNDKNWEVWIDWYGQRLLGGSRGEDYELAFASVPQEEWDKRPAAANAWIKAHLPPASAEAAEPQISDRHSLEGWLKDKTRAVAVAVAVRAALRVAPLTIYARQREFGQFPLTAVVLRAAAVARIVHPDPAHDRRLRSAADAARAVYASADAAADAAIAEEATAVAYAAADATTAAADEAYAFAYSRIDSDSDAAAAADAAVWKEVRADAAALLRFDAKTVVDLPLWRQAPEWAAEAFARFQTSASARDDWGVWIDWYEERLRGGSRGDAYELVFANVPQEEWDKGPAAANAWIKAHLPKAPQAAPPAELPAPLTGVDAPFAYGWTASQRVAVVAGAQSLPFYPDFSSEEDHRRALEVCRVGGERLLKTLRDGRYNARKEYGEALEYYLDDLPKRAGTGNILLANDQIRILHDMFLADTAMLPEGFASRLKSVIANQFALNAFYDLVQRHNEAVGAGNWIPAVPARRDKELLRRGRGQHAALVRTSGRARAAPGRTGRTAARHPVRAGARVRDRAAAVAAGNARCAELVAAADGDGGECVVGDVLARARHAGGAGGMAEDGG